MMLDISEIDSGVTVEPEQDCILTTLPATRVMIQVWQQSDPPDATPKKSHVAILTTAGLRVTFSIFDVQ